MKTWINVARYHMIDWVNFAVTCWGVLVIAFVINVALFASLPGGHGQAHYSGALALSTWLSACSRRGSSPSRCRSRSPLASAASPYDRSYGVRT